MDYREDYERGRRFRDERDLGWSDRERRRAYDRLDFDRRDYERRGDDRGFLERLADELRSWFHDEEARRRPREDREPPPGRWGGAERGRGATADDDVDRDWARDWGYVDRAEGRGRRERWSEPQRYTGASWTRERGYGGEGYERGRGAGDRYEEPRWGWGDPSAWGAEPGWAERRRGSPGAIGPHAGRGPRGYQRSDERIREDVCDVLCDHGYVDASEIDVAVLTGEVTLSGVVPERSQKRLAEEVAEQVPGVREVHNQLRVGQGGSGQEPQGRPPGDPRFRAA